MSRPNDTHYDQPVRTIAGNKLSRTLDRNDKYDIDTGRMAEDGSAAWDGERLSRPPTP